MVAIFVNIINRGGEGGGRLLGRLASRQRYSLQRDTRFTKMGANKCRGGWFCGAAGTIHSTIAAKKFPVARQTARRLSYRRRVINLICNNIAAITLAHSGAKDLVWPVDVRIELNEIRYDRKKTMFIFHVSIYTLFIFHFNRSKVIFVLWCLYPQNVTTCGQNINEEWSKNKLMIR